MKSAMTEPRPSPFASNFSGSSSYPLTETPVMKNEARRCNVAAISLSLPGRRGVESPTMGFKPCFCIISFKTLSKVFNFSEPSVSFFFFFNQIY